VKKIKPPFADVLCSVHPFGFQGGFHVIIQLLFFSTLDCPTWFSGHSRRRLRNKKRSSALEIGTGIGSDAYDQGLMTTGNAAEIPVVRGPAPSAVSTAAAYALKLQIA
jgi:hypothetical protein